MPHGGGKLGVTPFLAIQSSLHWLVLQLMPLTYVHSKNALKAFCDSSTLFLCTVIINNIIIKYLYSAYTFKF